MKKKLLFIALIVLPFFFSTAYTYPHDDNNDFVYLFNLGDNYPVYSSQHTSSIVQGDFSKIMVASIVLDNCDLDEEVVISSKVETIEDSSQIFQNNQYSVGDLLYLMILNNSDKAALSLAEHVGQSEESFVEMMNKKARSLGLSDTHFGKVYGDSPQNTTTLADLKTLYTALIQDIRFYHLVSATNYVITGNENHGSHQLINQNKLHAPSQQQLEYLDENLNPIQRPYTLEASRGGLQGQQGSNFFSLTHFFMNEKEYLLIVANEPEEQLLYERNYRYIDRLIKGDAIKTLNSKDEFQANYVVENSLVNEVAGLYKDSVHVLCNFGDSIQKKQINVQNLQAPLKKGDRVGSIEYSINGRYYTTVDILAATDIKSLPPSTFMYRIFNLPNMLMLIAVAIIYRVLFKKKDNNKP